MYNKLFTSILDSSVWLESTSTRIVWVTFLAAMDEDGFVRMATVANVAKRAAVTLEEAQKAIATLEGPDNHCPGQEHDGRRIERVDGGWMVINSRKYRDVVSREQEKEATRLRVARWRAKRKSNGAVTPSHEKVTVSDTDQLQIKSVPNIVASAPVEELPGMPKAGYHPDARAVLHILNEAAGLHYREVDANLKIISARLREPGVTIDGVRQMIQRQCQLWKGTDYGKYLRPETLFRPSKFEGYYAQRNDPVVRGGTNHRNDGLVGGVDPNKARRVLDRRAAEAAAKAATGAPVAGQVAGPGMHLTGHPIAR